MDWGTVFLPSTPLLELFLRGTVMYLGAFMILRIAGRRESGEINMTDLILIVIISEAASVGIGGEASSILDGIILVAVIVVWSLLLDYLSFRYTWVSKLLKPKPQPLIQHGELNRRTARREFITLDEINTQLRINGMTSISEVEMAHIEPNGQISFIKRSTS